MTNDQSKPTEFISIVVRLLGLAMLVIGLFIGIKVIFEAWDLYDQPQRIERFAEAIEQGSHIDSLIASLSPKLIKKSPSNEQNSFSSPSIENNDESLKITYFLAWFIAIILLMVIGGLASSAIRTGGQLALYDLQVKRFARLLMEEVQHKNNS
ncbi:MAG: hypothetical protein COB23_01200 [Methylophaga sp.]|nr:MAG: hypothetical protein COB23_01200 [Methylophaga sp.]